jgi:LytR cell envelope-related transcriptional attenuator
MSFARVRALTVVGVLFVCALVVVITAVFKDTQTNAGSGTDCAPDAIPADLRLPEEKNIKINVYNATDRQGLAEGVALDFENREFTVANRPTIKQANDPEKRKVEGVAELRYGPKAIGAAWVLRAYFLDEAHAEFDLERKDDVVDVVLGTEFRQLGTITEVNQSLAAQGLPSLEKGTCDANA